MSNPQMLAGAAFAAVAGAAVFFHFSTPQTVAASETKVGGSVLKKTLTNGGLYPEPAKKGLQKRPSGAMSVFTEGQPALGGAESGAAN